MMHKKKCICDFTFVKTFKNRFSEILSRTQCSWSQILTEVHENLSESETENNLETEVRETFGKIHRTCPSLNLLFLRLRENGNQIFFFSKLESVVFGERTDLTGTNGCCDFTKQSDMPLSLAV